MSLDVHKYHYALVSKIPESFARNSRVDRDGGPDIDLNLATKQHDEYTELLRRLGMDVLELPYDERHPESVFVADMAIVINGTALMCKPSTADTNRNRIGETAIVRTTLRNDLGLRIVEPEDSDAILEGTDVLFTGKEIIVGIGNHTNKKGAQCVAKAFPEYAVTIITLPPGNKHLQQIMTVAGPDVIVVTRGEVGQKCLQEMISRMTFAYRVMRVDEEAAANVLYANGVILHLDHNSIPLSFPIWEAKFDNRLELDYSELMRAGGYLTSGAILISKPGNYSKSFQTALEKGHHEL